VGSVISVIVLSCQAPVQALILTVYHFNLLPFNQAKSKVVAVAQRTLPL